MSRAVVICSSLGNPGAGDVLGDGHGGVVGGLGHQRLDRIARLDGRADLQAELGRCLDRGMRRHHEVGVLRDVAGPQIAEQHIEGHHLGERGRVAGRVGRLLVKDGARIHVDDDGSGDLGRPRSFFRQRLAGGRGGCRNNERERKQNARRAAHMPPKSAFNDAH